jgi:hypothetical protein
MDVLQSYGNYSACPSCAQLDPERLDPHIGPSLPRMHTCMLAWRDLSRRVNHSSSGDTRPAVPFSSLRLTLRRIRLYIRKLRLLQGHDLRRSRDNGSVGKRRMNRNTREFVVVRVFMYGRQTHSERSAAGS